MNSSLLRTRDFFIVGIFCVLVIIAFSRAHDLLEVELGEITDCCSFSVFASEDKPLVFERTPSMGVRDNEVSLKGAFFNVYNESKIISTNSQMVCISDTRNNYTFSVAMDSPLSVLPKEQVSLVFTLAPLDKLQESMLMVCPFELLIAGEESLTTLFYLEVQ